MTKIVGIILLVLTVSCIAPVQQVKEEPTQIDQKCLEENKEAINKEAVKCAHESWYYSPVSCKKQFEFVFCGTGNQPENP